ncbi:hypothetical protein [Chthonobacter albigriseus]|uniref:hypothetical protein n=1 Tax=Chthonobacter albigriseus TaxID=1683161 RepID=UPI0015EEAE66|nr:hypothetical protein [Chthonobacter albigriseus]
MTAIATHRQEKTAGVNTAALVLLIGLFANAHIVASYGLLLKGDFVAFATKTFGINVVALLAMYRAIQLVPQDEPLFADRWRVGLIGVCAILMLVPLTVASWLAVTLVGLYLTIGRRQSGTGWALGSILLGLAFSGQWARYIASIFRPYILSADAFVIGVFAGTGSQGNLVYSTDGSTVLQVLEACSSFSNLSWAILACVTVASFFPESGKYRLVSAMLLSCVVVVLINTIRIGIIALDPNLYDLAHGEVGTTIAGVTGSIAALLVPYMVLRR